MYWLWGHLVVVSLTDHHNITYRRNYCRLWRKPPNSPGSFNRMQGMLITSSRKKKMPPTSTKSVNMRSQKKTKPLYFSTFVPLSVPMYIQMNSSTSIVWYVRVAEMLLNQRLHPFQGVYLISFQKTMCAGINLHQTKANQAPFQSMRAKVNIQIGAAQLGGKKCWIIQRYYPMLT